MDPHAWVERARPDAVPLLDSTVRALNERQDPGVLQLTGLALSDPGLSLHILARFGSIARDIESRTGRAPRAAESIAHTIGLCGLEPLMTYLREQSPVAKRLGEPEAQAWHDIASRAFHAGQLARLWATPGTRDSAEGLGAAAQVMFLAELVFCCHESGAHQTLASLDLAEPQAREAAETQTLGWTMRDLATALAEAWNLPAFATLGLADETEPNWGGAVVLGARIARASAVDWYADEVQACFALGAEALNTDADAVSASVKRATAEAARSPLPGPPMRAAARLPLPPGAPAAAAEAPAAAPTGATPGNATSSSATPERKATPVSKQGTPAEKPGPSPAPSTPTADKAPSPEQGAPNAASATATPAPDTPPAPKPPASPEAEAGAEARPETESASPTPPPGQSTQPEDAARPEPEAAPTLESAPASPAESPGEALSEPALEPEPASVAEPAPTPESRSASDIDGGSGSTPASEPASPAPPLAATDTESPSDSASPSPAPERDSTAEVASRSRAESPADTAPDSAPELPVEAAAAAEPASQPEAASSPDTAQERARVSPPETGDVTEPKPVAGSGAAAAPGSAAASGSASTPDTPPPQEAPQTASAPSPEAPRSTEPARSPAPGAAAAEAGSPTVTYEQAVAKLNDLRAGKCTMVDALQHITHGLAGGLALERSAFVTLGNDRKTLKVGIHSGSNTDTRLRELPSSLATVPLFSKLLAKPAALRVTAENIGKVLPLIPQDVRPLLSTQAFFAMSVFVAGRPIGFFYADCDGAPERLDADRFQRFKNLCAGTGTALEAHRASRRK